jgi:hypothetical protein
LFPDFCNFFSRFLFPNFCFYSCVAGSLAIYVKECMKIASRCANVMQE